MFLTGVNVNAQSVIGGGGPVIDVKEITVTDSMAVSFAMEKTDRRKCEYYIGDATMPIKDVGSGDACWLVFVDECPYAGWEHPCKYFYIKKSIESGRIEKSVFILDSVRPPGDVDLRRVKVMPRFRTDRKPVVGKLQPYTDMNASSGHTYAVILSGGMNRNANSERYWNDCSFIYQTLRNTYHVPKENISVLISDGTDPADDMTLYSGGTGSSPLDLDGDGVPDTEYSATKANLSGVISSLSGRLTDSDHLLVFVTSHGGYDRNTGRSYLYMWNNEKLYDTELDACLDRVDAGFITVVLGQCNSGGFVGVLKRPNRIIAAACKADELSYECPELPFNEFMYHWTCALNGSDAYGNDITGWNCRKGLPIVKAWNYASFNDHYANSNYVFAHETPMQNSFTHSVANDLSLDSIPPTVDLCFDYYGKDNDMVSEMNTKTYVTPSPFLPVKWPKYYAEQIDEEDMDLRQFNFWKSPYIWIRNQEDGVENQETERPIIERRKPIFVYVKVRNRGVKSYNGNGMSVYTCWAKSSMAIPEDQWLGVAQSLKLGLFGGTFGPVDISQEIQAGNNSIIMAELTLANKNLTEMQKPGANLCILAYLDFSEDFGTIPVDSNNIAAVWNTNKLAQSNVIHSELEAYYKEADTMRVTVPNIRSTPKKYNIRVVSRDPKMNAVFSEAKVSVNMSKNLALAWRQGGSVSQAVQPDRNISEKLYILSDSSRIDRIELNPYQVEKISLNCNFLADKTITERKSYDIDLAMYDSETGQCLGGETFRVVQEPRPAINPEVDIVNQGGTVVLTAGNVSEDATYEWYDSEGRLIGTGASLTVPSGMSAESYTVKVEAMSDGAISFSEVSVSGMSAIRSVDANNNRDEVVVTFDRPVASRSSLRLAYSSGNTPVSEYTLDCGAESYVIPATGMRPGVYQVSLIENGKLAGSYKFVK